MKEEVDNGRYKLDSTIWVGPNQIMESKTNRALNSEQNILNFAIQISSPNCINMHIRILESLQRCEINLTRILPAKIKQQKLIEEKI